MKTTVSILGRVLLFAAALLLLDGGLITDIVGIAIVVVSVALYRGIGHIPPKIGRAKEEGASSV